MELIDYFYNYTKIGYKVIPVYPMKKIPVGTNWNHWNFQKCKNYFINNPNANMGFLLGDVVDVEGDTEEANQLINDLIGDVPHPAYKSSKSIHHLFLNFDKKLTATKFLGMEFRANKHHSVVPPSKHSDGSTYYWLKNCKINIIPDMPQALMEFYWKHRKVEKTKHKKKINRGLIETNCNICKNKELIHKNRLALEIKAFGDSYGVNWQCHNCREWDIRDLCREIRKKQSKEMRKTMINTYHENF